MEKCFRKRKQRLTFVFRMFKKETQYRARPFANAVLVLAKKPFSMSEARIFIFSELQCNVSRRGRACSVNLYSVKLADESVAHSSVQQRGRLSSSYDIARIVHRFRHVTPEYTYELCFRDACVTAEWMYVGISDARRRYGFARVADES